MARRFDYSRPTKIKLPGIPGGGKRPKRVFERKGVELRPLAGPEIPIPGEGQEELQAQFISWQATHPTGSLPEFLVWRWLVYKKKMVEGVDFLFQYPVFGGRTSFGGYLLDFYFPGRREGWRVQGLRYHRTHPDDRARDAIAKQILSSQGLLVIDLFEDDILTRSDFVLNLAWEGQQVAGREVTA